MSLLKKTFEMPKRLGGGTFKIVSKRRGLDRYKIVKLTKRGKEVDTGLCAGTQWLTDIVTVQAS